LPRAEAAWSTVSCVTGGQTRLLVPIAKAQDSEAA
jgi:hypothetical protein